MGTKLRSTHGVLRKFSLVLSDLHGKNLIKWCRLVPVPVNYRDLVTVPVPVNLRNLVPVPVPVKIPFLLPVPAPVRLRLLVPVPVILRLSVPVPVLVPVLGCRCRCRCRCEFKQAPRGMVGTNKFVKKEIMKGHVMVHFLYVQGTMQSANQELFASQV